MYDERAERRKSRAMLMIGVVALVVLLAAVIPSPFSVERPGPYVDTLGTVKIDEHETPVLAIPDREEYPTSGKLNLLTVQILGSPNEPESWLELVPALFDPSQRIAPTTEFYPSGVTEKERDAENEMLMDSSQAQAAAAAYRELGEPVGLRLSVAEVGSDGPADGVLRKGDRIISIGGKSVGDFEDLRDRIVQAGADAPLSIGIERDGAEQELSITPSIPEGGDEPLIGATISTSYDLPADVDISLSEIGGPSAGMVFALGIYDMLTPGELLGGLTVSGTGTVDADGEVGAIGGLEQKMWAASSAKSDLFLMPIENCADLPSRIPSGLTVAPVANLDEAIEAITSTADGETPAGTERCDAKQ